MNEEIKDNINEVKPITLDVPIELAEHKDMKTIIFFSVHSEDQLKAISEFATACQDTEKCHHKVFMRPLMMNVFQFVRGTNDKQLIGAHEIIFCPDGPAYERLLSTKNVVITHNCMCFVGDNDKKQKKKTKLIDWLLEEMEEIML